MAQGCGLRGGKECLALSFFRKIMKIAVGALKSILCEIDLKAFSSKHVFALSRILVEFVSRGKRCREL